METIMLLLLMVLIGGFVGGMLDFNCPGSCLIGMLLGLIVGVFFLVRDCEKREFRDLCNERGWDKACHMIDDNVRGYGRQLAWIKDEACIDLAESCVGFVKECRDNHVFCVDDCVE